MLSRLGDPIEVEIAVEDWQDFDLSQLSVGVGNAEQYELFGLEYQPILDDLNFTLVGPNLAGEVKVLISSRDPVSEPFLELLLVLNWSSGSTLRDYTLLFDPPLPTPAASPTSPPATTGATDATNAQAPVTEQLRVVTLSPPPMPPVPPAPASSTDSPQPGQPDVRTQVAINVDDASDASAAAPVPTADALNVERRPYRVRNNDTLWVIARQFQPAGDTENLYQFLVSLHDLNRNAFINGNISMLRTGAELLIPTSRDVSSINPASAQAVFEGRWADGTRVATGTASAPPPEFTTLEQPEAAASPEPAQAEPTRAPGTELPTASANSEPATAGSTEVIAAGTQMSADSAEPAISTSVTEEPPVPNVVAALPPSGNPYLQRVVDSAQKIQQLLETRQQRLVEVEEQLLLMRIQMQEAQIAALELNAKLQQAVVLREQQRAANLRTAAFLGTLVAGLLVALGLALRKTMMLHREIHARGRWRPAGRSHGQVMAVQEPSLSGHAQAEVREIDEMPPGGSDEIVRDMDKVPDIALPPQETDFLVAEAPPAVEQSDKDPTSPV